MRSESSDHSYDTTQVVNQRRKDVKLPDFRKHIAGATGFFLAALAMPILTVNAFGDRTDAFNAGAVLIEAPARADTGGPDMARLDDLESGALPDLLAGEVALGDNPTDLLRGTPLNPTISPRPAPTPDIKHAALSDRPAPRIISLPDVAGLAPLDPSLTRNTSLGKLPGRNADGLTPLEAYKRPAHSSLGRKPVSIIIGGLGINPTLTQRAIDELPADVTLSFAAQSPGLQSWINRARSRGHEVLLEVPMAGQDDSLATPHTLRPAQSADQVRRDLQFHLARAQGYVGIINYGGEAFLNRSDSVVPMLDELEASGLGLFTDGTFPAPSLASLSRSIDLPYARGFGVIDPEANRLVITDRLEALSSAARDGRHSLGVGFAFPETLDVVKGWTATFATDELILVPASSALSPGRG